MNTQQTREARERLIVQLERWYAWLCASPAILAGASDRDRMIDPVVRLRRTHEWLSSSSIAKTEWFLDEGFQLCMARLEKGDYDAYE
ncbi:hypothetical protein ACFFNY_17815 [Paenibacillus hodogayensis]|uniref:Uncharacterized protein n=1 Tax=Paenibacillus hodogayensis TaxID=279208 RepID=A0ABV5VZL0_9BACL